MTALFDFASLALLALVVVYLLRIARALEAMVPPPAEDDAPYDYYAEEAKRGNRRSALYNDNKERRLPE